MAHLPWISFVLMIEAFFLAFAALKAAGIGPTAQTSPLAASPEG